MYVVKNSERALLVALIPLAVVHAVLLAMALLGAHALPSQATMPPPDMIFIHYAGRLAVDGALLFAGHLALRQFNICSRTAYALMGGAMAATSYLLAMRNGLLMFAPLAGSEITAGLLPTVAGALAGFLYGQFAGLMAVAVAPEAAAPATAAEIANAAAPRCLRRSGACSHFDRRRHDRGNDSSGTFGDAGVYVHGAFRNGRT